MESGASLAASGGLVYHGRALRYRDTLWAPFRAHIASWVEQRLPVRDELVLVGPSAGHCLPLPHLARFRRIFVLEPDPIARRWLAVKLDGAKIMFEARDLLVTPLLSGAAALDAILDRVPAASVLFCNVLGQVHFGLSDDEHDRWQAAFVRRIAPRLEGRAWASFHDRWSLDAGIDEPHPPSRIFPRYPSDEELGAAWFGAEGPIKTVLDHSTRQLFPEALPRRYLSWQITKEALHVVEALPAT